MSQQANNPVPMTDAGNQKKKMPYGGRDTTKMKPDSPEIKQTVQALFKANFLNSGTGLGTPVWDPQTGIRREQMRREARGMSAQERLKIFKEAGLTDHDGMARIFERAYTSPERAFMLSKGR